MKKIIVLLFVTLLAFGLVACGEKEFAVDGEFLAYEVSVSRNAPQVTFVTVTIEDGEIAGYNIDVRQGSRTGDGTTEAPYAWAWNAMTKKELGDDYNMLPNSEIGKEWYEQAASIEAYWLENGVEAMTKDEDNVIDNITGVSIKDAYSAVALAAIENAKAGKFVAIYSSGSPTSIDLYSAEMTLTSKGEIDTLVLDVLQSTRNAETGTFEWRPLSKQELGDDYGMKGAGGYAFVNGEWISQGTTTLEWYEQVALITDYVQANGWSDSLQPVASRGGSLNGTTLITELAGATIRTGGYYTVLKSLFTFAGDSVK